MPLVNAPYSVRVTIRVTVQQGIVTSSKMATKVIPINGYSTNFPNICAPADERLLRTKKKRIIKRNKKKKATATTVEGGLNAKAVLNMPCQRYKKSNNHNA